MHASPQRPARTTYSCSSSSKAFAYAETVATSHSSLQTSTWLPNTPPGFATGCSSTRAFRASSTLSQIAATEWPSDCTKSASIIEMSGSSSTINMHRDTDMEQRIAAVSAVKRSFIPSFRQSGPRERPRQAPASRRVLEGRRRARYRSICEAALRRSRT